MVTNKNVFQEEKEILTDRQIKKIIIKRRDFLTGILTNG